MKSLISNITECFMMTQLYYGPVSSGGQSFWDVSGELVRGFSVQF